jgi:hypothetical protein
VLGQELAIFSCEDVVGHCRNTEACTKLLAQSKHQSGFPGAYRSRRCQYTYQDYAYISLLTSKAYCKCAVFPISALNDGHLTSHEAAGSVEDLVGVTMVCSCM